MLPTAKNQKKRLTNRTGRCTIQLSTNRVTPPLSVPPPCRVFPLLPDNTPPQGALRRSLWPSWGGRKSSRKAALSSFPGEYLPHAAGQTARRQQRAAGAGPRPRATRRGDRFPPGRPTPFPPPLLIAGISSAERVPCFSSECRPFAGTGPVPGGGARHAPAGSAAGRRPAAAARHPGPRPAGAYRS